MELMKIPSKNIETILFTIEQVSEVTGISLRRLRYELLNKRISHYKIGRSIRFSKKNIDEFIQRVKDSEKRKK